MNRITTAGMRLRSFLASVVAFAVSAALAPVALAFHHHLSPEDVREAYFIGRDQNHRGAFFANYVHSPQLPDTGPDLASIEFRTPYEQVAIRARDASDDYFAPDAAQDYVEHPIHEVIVRVLIFDTQTFYFHGNASAADAARTFKYLISQNGRQLEPSKLTADGTETLGLGSAGSGVEPGIDVHLHFDTSQFKSDDPVTVEVLAPTGQTYSTTFDLAQLK